LYGSTYELGVVGTSAKRSHHATQSRGPSAPQAWLAPTSADHRPEAIAASEWEHLDVGEINHPPDNDESSLGGDAALERLGRAAQLHHDGELTDAEYEAIKASTLPMLTAGAR
jgi:hypothetical protein